MFGGRLNRVMTELIRGTAPAVIGCQPHSLELQVQSCRWLNPFRQTRVENRGISTGYKVVLVTEGVFTKQNAKKCPKKRNGRYSTTLSSYGRRMAFTFPMCIHTFILFVFDKKYDTGYIH